MQGMGGEASSGKLALILLGLREGLADRSTGYSLTPRPRRPRSFSILRTLGKSPLKRRHGVVNLQGMARMRRPSEVERDGERERRGRAKYGWLSQ